MFYKTKLSKLIKDTTMFSHSLDKVFKPLRRLLSLLSLLKKLKLWISSFTPNVLLCIYAQSCLIVLLLLQSTGISKNAYSVCHMTNLLSLQPLMGVQRITSITVITAYKLHQKSENVLFDALSFIYCKLLGFRESRRVIYTKN